MKLEGVRTRFAPSPTAICMWETLELLFMPI